MDAAGPNAEQITYWNEAAGPRWVAHQELLDLMIRSFGEAAMERMGVHAGERVLDVGCGTGQSTLELARRAGPTGAVMGIDVSAPMLAHARGRTRAAGSASIVFLEADAQTHRFEPEGFDVCFSRFGTMFFADPSAAFSNLRSALRPGGRLGFVCWQALADNPWMLVPLMAAAQHVPLPTPPEPGSPGPFSFADAQRVRGILESAGFAKVTIEDHPATLTVGTGSLDQAVEVALQLGPLGRALRETDPGLRPAVAAAVREAFTPYHTPEGVRMAAAAWLVTGRRGASDLP